MVFDTIVYAGQNGGTTVLAPEAPAVFSVAGRLCERRVRSLPGYLVQQRLGVCGEVVPPEDRHHIAASHLPERPLVARMA